MSEMEQRGQTRVIVIPRELEEFFRERLTKRFVDREDVRVIVDRRAARGREQRRADAPGAPVNSRGDRRYASASWSLADMPVESF